MKPGVYLPFAQTPTWALPGISGRALTRRSAADRRRADAAHHRAVDPDQPISAVRTMDEIIDLDVADRHQQMVLLGAFAGLALLLASLGLYGVLCMLVRSAAVRSACASHSARRRLGDADRRGARPGADRHRPRDRPRARVGADARDAEPALRRRRRRSVDLRRRGRIARAPSRSAPAICRRAAHRASIRSRC